MNLRNIVYKLQKALCLKGRYIKINQIQFYSEKLNKMSTKFVLKESVNINGKKKDVTLLETFRMIEVVNFLIVMLDGGE